MKTNEHVLFERIHKTNNENLVKLLPDEKILTIQKRHWIILVIPLLLHAVTILLLVVGSIFLVLQHFHPSIPFILIDGAFLLLSFLATLGMYTCMDWFYQFYIITNLRVINVRFFKIQGDYYTELFIRKGAESEITRVARNIVYDLLNIEDVYIKLHREERAEPFIMEVPTKPAKIEELLEELTIGAKEVAL